MVQVDFSIVGENFWLMVKLSRMDICPGIYCVAAGRGIGTSK